MDDLRAEAQFAILEALYVYILKRKKGYSDARGQLTQVARREGDALLTDELRFFARVEKTCMDSFQNEHKDWKRWHELFPDTPWTWPD